MQTVYFVRHCEPDYTNHSDMLRPLTEKGEVDAVRLTEFFQDKDVEAVLSSPYLRAMDTVIGIADSIGQEVETDFDFRERRVTDGSWVEDLGSFLRDQWMDFSYHLPEGECLEEVRERNVRALFRALDRHPGETLVIGTHGTALSTIISYFDPSFGYEEFMRIVKKMPWVVRMEFEGRRLVHLDRDVEWDERGAVGEGGGVGI